MVEVGCPIGGNFDGEADGQENGIAASQVEGVDTFEGVCRDGVGTEEADLFFEFAPHGGGGGFGAFDVAHDGLPGVEHGCFIAAELEDVGGAIDRAKDVDIKDIGAKVGAGLGGPVVHVVVQVRSVRWRRSQALSRVSRHSDSGSLSATMPEPTLKAKC